MRPAAHGLFAGRSLIAPARAAESSAQQTSDPTTTPGTADPGLVSGSPWLWLLFVIVCFVVIYVLSRRRRGS